MADKVIDLGRKPTPMDEPKVAAESSEQKVYYPSFYLSDRSDIELPEGEFTFTGKAKVVSKTETTRGGKKKCSYDIELHSIQPQASKKAKSSAEGLEESLSEY